MSHLRDRRAFGNIGTRKFRGARFGDALSPRGPQYTKEGRVLDYSTDVGPFTIVDQSGEGNTATLYSGRGLTMDAVNDTVVYDTNYASTSRTAAVWMRVDALGARALNGATGTFTFTPTATGIWEQLSSTATVTGDLTWTAGSDCDISDLTCATEHWTHNDWSNPTGDTSNGKPIVDSGPNDYHGTCIGCSGFTGEGIGPEVAGIVGYDDAQWFNGTDTKVDTGLNVSATTPTELYVEATVIVSDLVGIQAFVSQNTGGNNVFELRTLNGKPSFAMGDSGGTFSTVESPDNIPLNVPVVIRGEWNGSTKKIFVNGVEKASVTQSSINGSVSTDAFIGSRPDGSQIADGLIYAVSIDDQSGAVLAYTGRGATPWNDTIGSNDGTPSGTFVTVGQKRATIPQTADRNWNRYMFFDGVNDYVSTSLDIGALAVTYLEVEVKVFVSSVVSDQTVIGQMNGGNDRPFEIRINADGTVSFGIGGAANSYTTTTSSQSLLINNTYVLKGIYNGTTKAIYIDGVLANSEAQTSIVGSALSNTVRIGSRTNDSKWFSGIPTYAKITTEDGLIADWVNTGNTNADWVDNTDGYNGTVNGSPANMMVSASDANDQIDALGTTISEPRLNTQQLNLFGEGEYSLTPDSASLDLTTAATWELWGDFYATVADTNTYISKYDDNTNNREWIVSKPSSVSAGEVRLLVDSDGASGGTETSIISGITTGIGHLVITKTGTVLKAYWNSVEITAPDFTGSSIYNGNAAVLIGAVLPSSPTSFCSNKIGSAKIYNTALTAAEVLTNYNTQKSLYGL